MDISFDPVSDILGARVTGVGLKCSLTELELACLEDALEAYGFLVFPLQQDVTPAEQVAFSRRFGPLERVDIDSARMAELPEIFVVGNTGEELVTFAPIDEDGELEWHTDHIHLAVPARASLLLAREVPEVGGDTLFACMYTAYETLDEERRSQCDTLDVINSVTGLNAYIKAQAFDAAHRGDIDEAAEPPAVWPLVRRHPRTGRKALYFGNQVSIGIVGWPDDEARTFVRNLTEHACQEAFCCRHRWREGDAVLWDNRRVLHAGTPYDTRKERREMHRTTIRETTPVR